MGQTAADTQREITGLRLEITDAASELDKRVTELLDVRSRAGEAMDWGLRMVEEKPRVVAGIGAGLALGTVLLTANSIKARRKRKTAAARLAAFRESSQGQAARIVEDAVAQARALLGASGATLTNLAESEPAEQKITTSEPSMVKKLIWTALTAGSLALAGIVARKLSASVWQAIMHEEPPTAST
ncbi:MAG TPA: hypothetical protein VHX16_02930 [Chloroflexota bacterium]|jgi:hypothetical protein|nr:hypothetical protein [Chloroflexota bacterium]